MQDDINAFLTARMEEDKIAASTATNGKGKGNGKPVDDVKAEENYGEEEVEE
jgi:hypothetical protein